MVWCIVDNINSAVSKAKRNKDKDILDILVRATTIIMEKSENKCNHLLSLGMNQAMKAWMHALIWAFVLLAYTIRNLVHFVNVLLMMQIQSLWTAENARLKARSIMLNLTRQLKEKKKKSTSAEIGDVKWKWIEQAQTKHKRNIMALS